MRIAFTRCHRREGRNKKGQKKKNRFKGMCSRGSRLHGRCRGSRLSQRWTVTREPTPGEMLRNVGPGLVVGRLRYHEATTGYQRGTGSLLAAAECTAGDAPSGASGFTLESCPHLCPACSERPTEKTNHISPECQLWSAILPWNL